MVNDNKTTGTNTWKDGGCKHRDHFPGVMLMYIAPGSYFDYRCPACGHVTRLYGSGAIW